jgi:hypothetical protein
VALLVTNDIRLGNFASLIDRYLLTSLLAIQLCIGFLIGSTLQSRKAVVRKISVAVMAAVFLLEASSCIWYLNQRELRLLGIGNGRIMVADSHDPISVRTAKLQLLTLAHVMDENSRLIFSLDTGPEAKRGIHQFLLMTPSQSVVDQYKTIHLSARPIGDKGNLWLLTQKSRRRHGSD